MSAYTYTIFVFSWWSVDIMKCPFLILSTFLALRSIFSNILIHTIRILVFLHTVFACKYFFCFYSQSVCVFRSQLWIFFFFVNNAYRLTFLLNLSSLPLLGVFSLFTFNVVIDMFGFKFTSCYLISICPICSLFIPYFSPAFLSWIKHCLFFYFISSNGF